jgi:hypothetical protein
VQVEESPEVRRARLEQVILRLGGQTVAPLGELDHAQRCDRREQRFGSPRRKRQRLADLGGREALSVQQPEQSSAMRDRQCHAAIDAVDRVEHRTTV